jgi:MoxR-like ATPase
MKIKLLIGAPGVGKTREALEHASSTGAELVYHLLHQWSDADELFYGINVVAAVAGDADNVKQEGVLARAARLSLSGKVTLCLDELDKTTEATEALLLDFLQYGRVPIAPSVQMQSNMDNITVFITTNDMRPLTEALMRRCRRVFMSPLPVAQQEAIIAERTNAPIGLVRVAWKAARWVAESEGNANLSINEGFGLVDELLCEATTKDKAVEALIGWACRRADNVATAKNNCPHIAAMWAETKLAQAAVGALSHSN